jgi:SAM-dependent methyltransferase
MITVARQREGGEKVEWIIGKASAIDTTDADLVVMTGNISGYIDDDAEWLDVLGCLRGALRPGGRLAFSSRNPDTRAWEHWGGGAFLDNGRVRWPESNRFAARVHADQQHSSLVFGDEVLVADSEYRVRSMEELRSSLVTTGFEIERLYGGWDRRPLTAAGDDLVFVARRF